MEDKQQKSILAFIRRYDTVFAFLTLEIIALTAFGIGGVTGIKILEILGFFVGLFAFPFIRNHYSNEDIKKNLFFLIPFGVLSVLMGFSAFYVRYYGMNLTGIVYMLLTALGTIGFFLLGFSVDKNKAAKKEYILYALLGGLALYCVIVGLYSLIRYGFFYAAQYRGMFYYYKGVFFPVDTETKMLLGFEFTEVSLKYGSIAGIILASSGAGLFALSPKNDRRKFIILSSFALIGLLYLLVIPYVAGLVFVLLAYAFGFLYTMVRKVLAGKDNAKKNVHEISKWVFYILIGLVAIGVVLFLTEPWFGLISKLCNAVFGRVPGFIANTLAVTNDVFYNGAADLHRFNLTSFLFGYHANYLDPHMTRFFPLNVLWQNGVLAFLLLVYVVMYALKNSRDYLAKGEDDLHFRLSVIAMMGALFLYICFYSDELPLPHTPNEFMPLSQSNYIFVLVFLFGLSYTPNRAKEESVHE